MGRGASSFLEGFFFAARRVPPADAGSAESGAILLPRDERLPPLADEDEDEDEGADEGADADEDEAGSFAEERPSVPGSTTFTASSWGTSSGQTIPRPSSPTIAKTLDQGTTQ